MKNFDYKKTYQLMRKFYDLGMNEVRIMDYLMQTDVAEVTYAGLTKAIGLESKANSNIRKAVHHLQELGLVCIVKKCDGEETKDSYNPMKACFIADGWMETLLNT